MVFMYRWLLEQAVLHNSIHKCTMCIILDDLVTAVQRNEEITTGSGSEAISNEVEFETENQEVETENQEVGTDIRAERDSRCTEIGNFV